MGYALRKALAAAAVAGATILGTAQQEVSAMTLPHTHHHEQKLDHKQFGYTDIVVSRDGVATVSTLFSNGMPVDGDHFVARIVFRNAAGQPMAAVEQKKGLNGAFGGPAREGRVTNTLRLTKAQWAQVRSVEVRMGHYDAVDDRQFWAAVSPQYSRRSALEAGVERISL